MSDKVKVKVADHHTRTQYSIGEQTVSKNEVSEVEPNTTVANAVRAGTLELVEGEIPSQFQGDDGDRTESEEDSEEDGETQEPEQDEKDLEDYTKEELKDLAEEKGLKKSGTKSEIVERLKNYE